MYISDHDFRLTNVNAAGEVTNDTGYNLYVFDRRYQRDLETAQPIKKIRVFWRYSCWDIWLWFSFNKNIGFYKQ